MFSGLRWKLSGVMLCTMMIAGCGNASPEPKNDDVYVMMKEEDLYIKYPEKDAEKVASDISDVSFGYIDGKGLVYTDDEDNLYLYKNGEQAKVAANVSSEFGPFGYGISQDTSTFAYLSDEDELYAFFDGGEKIKVASDVYYYTISPDGERIFYVNDEDDLFSFTSDEQKDKIASDVDGYVTSDDGSMVAIYTSEDDLYIRDMNEEDKTKVLTDEELFYPYINVDNNGDMVYLLEYDFEKGELYFKASGEEDGKRIASDVASYDKQGDTLHYVDVDGKLYKRKVNEEKSEKLAEGVLEYFVAGDRVYYIDEDDNLFSVNNSKKEKIGVDISGEDGDYEASIIGEDITYLTKDNELFVNKKKISDNVVSYVSHVDRVVYKTMDDALYAVSVNKLDKKEKFEDPDSYSSIFYGNQLVYNSTLSAEDIAGVWEISDEYGKGFIEITQDEELDEYLDFTFYDSYELDEEYGIEITDATSKTITLEDGLLFTKVSDKEWRMSDIDDEDDYVSLIKSTDEKLSDFIEENESSYEEDEYDSYYDEYDSYYDEEESY